MPEQEHLTDTSLVRAHSEQLGALSVLPGEVKQIKEAMNGLDGKLDKVIIWQEKRDAECKILNKLAAFGYAIVGAVVGKYTS